MRAAVPLLAAVALVAAARIEHLAAAIRPALESGRLRLPLAVHVACAGVAIWLTGVVFATPDPAPAVVGMWAVAALAAALAWVAALVPRTAGTERRALLAATIGVGAGLGLLAAGAATLTRGWWQSFGRATLMAVYGMLRAAGFEAGVEPERLLVGTPRFVAEITPYCSGYQGMGLMLVFLGAYLYLFRDRLRFPRALWLLPIGVVLAWVLNAVRIALLVMIGDAGHEEIAVQGFHYHAGTLFFCAMALGLGTWAGSSRTFSTGAPTATAASDHATAAYVMPFLVLLATSLVTGLVSRDGFDALYGLRVLVALAVLWWLRRQLGGAGWRVSWVGAAIGVVAFGLWLALAGGEYLRHDFGPGLATLDPASRVIWLGFRLLGAVVVVPLAEELAFRGYVARRLTAADFASVPLDRVTWPALLAAAALFGLMHTDVVAGTTVGVLYGVAARRRGQLGDAVFAHAVTNALLAAMALRAAWSS